MADRTVSSLWLDKQFVTKRMPSLCRTTSLHSGSMLRLQSPPEITRDKIRDKGLTVAADIEGDVTVTPTHPKLHKVLILLSQHVQEEVSHLQLPQILHVLWIVCKIGQISQNLFLCL